MPWTTNVMAALFSLEVVYVLTGLVLWVFAALNFRDRTNARRVGSALFWFILGAVFVFGSVIPDWMTGVLVLVMVGLDGLGRVCHISRAGDEMTRTDQVIRRGRPLGDRVFVPVLLIPLLAGCFALAFWLVGRDVNHGALVGLGLGGAVAVGAGLSLTRGTPREAFVEGRRLNDLMGAVVILPQLLASLGAIFAVSEVGNLMAAGIKQVVPGDNLFLLVAASCLGMTLFTVATGNSFAAFPVIVSGVLIPLIVKPFGVDPAMAAIITLTAGSTGTLMTPMAANFNIVPAALLNMRDQYGVIKFQIPFALTMWVLHVLLLWVMIRLL